MITLAFADHAWEDYLYWRQTDKKIMKRINSLIKAIKREPFEGIGEPEPLKYNWTGYWSRRINKEHRLVYKFEANVLTVVQCRYHY